MDETAVYDSMSINRTLVPQIDRLKKLYEKLGHLEFSKLFGSYETLIGSSESIKYIKEILEKQSNHL